SSPPHSVIPEITKPLGSQFRVAHRVLNMAMPEILLDGAGIDAFVREVKATGMAEHMWMDRKGELSVKASAQNNMADGAIAEWAAPFGEKDIGKLQRGGVQLAEGAQFGAVQRMRCRYTTFQPTDMQQRCLQIDGVPP